MNNEDKILALLERQGAMLEQHGKMLEQHGKILENINTRLNQVEHDTTWIRIEIENQIEPNQKLLFENQSLLIETTAKKEDVEALREELGIQKFQLNAVTERLHTDAG